MSWPPCKGASLRERGDSMWGVLHTPCLSPTPPGLLFPLPCPVSQEVGLCGPHHAECWSSRGQQPEAGGRENSSENPAPTPSSPHPSSVWLPSRVPSSCSPSSTAPALSPGSGNDVPSPCPSAQGYNGPHGGLAIHVSLLSPAHSSAQSHH